MSTKRRYGKRTEVRRLNSYTRLYLVNLILAVCESSNKHSDAMEQCDIVEREAERTEEAFILHGMLVSVIALWLGIPEDKNPSGESSYCGKDDYCRDWFYWELDEVAKKKTHAEKWRAAQILIEHGLSQSVYLTPEEFKNWKETLRGNCVEDIPE